MKFRPCIDIHNGRVKQIVGASLKDAGNFAEENFVSSQDAAYYAKLYKEHDLPGGHVIMLNPLSSAHYEETRRQAQAALRAYPGGLQIGGGINATNAESFLDEGASHVIVSSYVFRDGGIDTQALDRMVSVVGQDRLVLDLSCKQRDGEYYIVTDRWQNFTDVKIDKDTLTKLSGYCAEFLVHAADVEGLKSGVDKELIKALTVSPIPTTYAGGVRDYNDLDIIGRCGEGRIDFTVGSSLDIFGGHMDFKMLTELKYS